MNELRKAFRPEFLNRLDETVLFHRLDRKEVRSIVDVQLTRFASRLAKRDLILDISDEAKDLLSNIGFDPTYGARPLKRAIQQHLENPLAQEILAGHYVAGDTIVVELQDGELLFGKRVGGAGAVQRVERPNAPGGRA